MAPLVPACRFGAAPAGIVAPAQPALLHGGGQNTRGFFDLLENVVAGKNTPAFRPAATRLEQFQQKCEAVLRKNKEVEH
jgi:hypothetical protein